jgi:CheY-like chemotaxis protein
VVQVPGQNGIVALVVASEVIKDQITDIKGYVNGFGLYRDGGPDIVFGFLRSLEVDDGRTWWLVAKDSEGSGICEVYGRKTDRLKKADCVKDMSSTRKVFVLLVEDEAYVRDIAREVLEMCGYTVLSAKDANEGISIFERHQGEIHLLVTDVVMPGMNGRELAERLMARQASLKAIFISGYTDNEVLRNGFDSPKTVYLQKPFTLAALSRKVREVIDGGVRSTVIH